MLLATCFTCTLINCKNCVNTIKIIKQHMLVCSTVNLHNMYLFFYNIKTLLDFLNFWFIDIIDKAFSRFSVPEVSPIKRLPDGLNVMELFHGPTWSFKDLALSCVGQFIPYFLSKRKKHFNIIVGRERTKSFFSLSSVLPFVFETLKMHIRRNHRNN